MHFVVGVDGSVSAFVSIDDLSAFREWRLILYEGIYPLLNVVVNVHSRWNIRIALATSLRMMMINNADPQFIRLPIWQWETKKKINVNEIRFFGRAVLYSVCARRSFALKSRSAFPIWWECCLTGELQECDVEIVGKNECEFFKSPLPFSCTLQVKITMKACRNPRHAPEQSMATHWQPFVACQGLFNCRWRIVMF